MDSESLTNLWWKKDKNGIKFLSGNLSATTKVMVLPNINKKSKRDPDYFLSLEPMEVDEDAPKVKVSDITKRKISARDLVEDFRKGMDNPELMKKYQVSQQGLHKLFQKLVAASRLSQSDVNERFHSTKP